MKKVKGRVDLPKIYTKKQIEGEIKARWSGWTDRIKMWRWKKFDL